MIFILIFILHRLLVAFRIFLNMLAFSAALTILLILLLLEHLCSLNLVVHYHLLLHLLLVLL